MNLRAIGALHASVLHIMTLDGSDINGIPDLKGKRIAVGPEGCGTIPFLGQVLGLHGMTINDITPSFLTHADGFSQLADGTVDAAFALSGYPADAVMQAQAKAKLKFIATSDAVMADALERYPSYNNVILSADVYGTDAEGSLLSVNNMLIVDTGMDEETAYHITRAIYDHMDEFRAENVHACQIGPEQSLSLKIPLHRGAERHFGK